jgi:hypothetical protein
MTLLIFLVGTLLGVLAGGTLCVHFLRSAIAADIGPQLQRMHADIDPRLRGMQNQLDLIESSLNYALATRYAEMSSSTPPHVTIPLPGADR